MLFEIQKKGAWEEERELTSAGSLQMPTTVRLGPKSGGGKVRESGFLCEWQERNLF